MFYSGRDGRGGNGHTRSEVGLQLTVLTYLAFLPPVGVNRGQPVFSDVGSVNNSWNAEAAGTYCSNVGRFRPCAPYRRVRRLRPEYTRIAATNVTVTVTVTTYYQNGSINVKARERSKKETHGQELESGTSEFVQKYSSCCSRIKAVWQKIKNLSGVQQVRSRARPTN